MSNQPCLDRFDSSQAEPSGCSVLVCLPPGATLDPVLLPALITERMREHTTYSPSRLCGGHLAASPRLTPAEQARLLVSPRPAGALLHCTGGPLGLLDRSSIAEVTEQVAAAIHEAWEDAVAGTPEAMPRRAFGLPDQDQDPELLEAQDLAFLEQPRVTAVVQDMMRGAPLPEATEFGPALEAHQLGSAAFTRYVIGSVGYGDALITLDRTALRCGHSNRSPLLQSLADRDAYTTAARDYLAGLDPRTLLVATHGRF